MTPSNRRNELRRVLRQASGRDTITFQSPRRKEKEFEHEQESRSNKPKKYLE